MKSLLGYRAQRLGICFRRCISDTNSQWPTHISGICVSRQSYRTSGILTERNRSHLAPTTRSPSSPAMGIARSRSMFVSRSTIWLTESTQVHINHTDTSSRNRPTTTSNPSPVLLNWNGGAFVFDAHGTDELFCRRIANEAGYTVLDASYALAPKYPFPSALKDAQDLLLYVLQHPDVYDANNIVLSGFSSGGNLALAAASSPKQQSEIPTKAMRAVVAFYPPTSMVIHPAEKKDAGWNSHSCPCTTEISHGNFQSRILTA